MVRICLFHKNNQEGRQRAAVLRTAGYRVAWVATDAAVLRKLKEKPPGAVVIDLNRQPSQGRDIALWLRKSPATRHVPLLLAEGDREKVARIRELLPDAVFTTWRGIRATLKQALRHPPADPIVPKTVLDGYSGVPLIRKLGIKPHSAITLVGAPPGFEKTLGPLPQGVALRKSAQARCDLLLWFARSRKEVERRVRRMGARAGKGGLWILWPKKASGLATDLSQAVVRTVGLAAGLVDYKISAIDATWAGLRFSRRKSK